MNNGYVRTAMNDGVATITFHHPKSNSLPGDILRGIAQAISQAGAGKATRAIVLRSDGEKAFCAGASFDELLAVDSEENGRAFFSGFAWVINAVRKAPCFVIGRIHARAVGGGVGLAAACDVSYAHENASARLSELAIGIGPFVIGPAVERKMGTTAFTLMTTTPDTWREAAWCTAHGLYAATFNSTAELDAAIDEHARQLATYSAEAMAELKAVLWRGTNDWDQLLEERAAISGRLVLSEFTRRAISQFKADAARR